VVTPILLISSELSQLQSVADQLDGNAKSQLDSAITHLTILAYCSILFALYAFGALYFAIKNQADETKLALQQLCDGNLKVQISSASANELGHINRLINRFNRAHIGSLEQQNKDMEELHNASTELAQMTQVSADENPPHKLKPVTPLPSPLNKLPRA